MDGWTNGKMGEWMIDGWMDGWMDGRMEKWVDNINLSNLVILFHRLPWTWL